MTGSAFHMKGLASFSLYSLMKLGGGGLQVDQRVKHAMLEPATDQFCIKAFVSAES